MQIFGVKPLWAKGRTSTKDLKQNCGAFEKQQEKGTAQLVIVRNEVGIFIHNLLG